MTSAPQYVPVPPPVAQPKNGLGTAGFVLGLIGLLVAFVPLVGVVAWPLVILGLIFSIIGVVRASKGQANNKGLAIAGIVLSAAGFVVAILWATVITVAVSEFSDNRLHFAQDVPGGHTVEFVVTTTSPVNVTAGDGFDDKQEIVQPGGEWRQKAGYQGGMHFMSITATATDLTAAGQVGCTVLIDGTKVAENIGTAGAVCTATVN
ncbi:DUF4190 domain-containing protein [Amycolatopsis nigrescens]|uniref:DUF4190 domain-containing protein n=1 Tax=Amycolatopsis nigrescens TaxID=381445 RepID=UPI00035F73E3|nr:DUF4190 domain-containing protein [Amycolatopsis nigrescens]